jgi:hypothetical protein
MLGLWSMINFSEQRKVYLEIIPLLLWTVKKASWNIVINMAAINIKYKDNEENRW